MKVLRNIFLFTKSLLLDALFPISGEESKLFSMTPELAVTELPTAPKVPINDSYSIFAYKNPLVKKLVWNIKYKKSAHCLSIAGLALYRSLPKEQVVLVPIPITQERRNERGYNQCELMLLEIKRHDIHNLFTTNFNLLIKTHHVARQTLKNREERLSSTQGIFAVNSEEAKLLHPDDKIIVVDDVITTGSTLKEALTTLRTAGFINVSGLSLAH